MLGKVMAVGVRRILFLKIAAVGEENPAEVPRRRGGIDLPGETVPDQKGEVAAVIEMGMGEDHRIDLSRRDRQRFPISETELFKSLKESAVDEDLL
jgi:hypothetical protein